MVTEVKWKDPWSRRAFLFQSLPQMASWLACLGVVYLVIFVVARLANATTINPRYFAIGFLGTLPSLYSALPCVFTVPGFEPRKVARMLDSTATRLGYECISDSDADTVYRSRLPRLLRWEENRIVVGQYDGGTHVQAPRIAAQRLRKALLEQMPMRS